MKLGRTQTAQDRRETLLSNWRIGVKKKRGQVQSDTNGEQHLQKDLKYLVKLGILKQERKYYSCAGTILFTRVKETT